MSPPYIGWVQERGQASGSKARAGDSPGYSLVICHFRGEGKLILGMKPALESRDWRQGQLGSGEVGRSRVVSSYREVWVLETVQGEGHGGRRVWTLGTGLPGSPK